MPFVSAPRLALLLVAMGVVTSACSILGNVDDLAKNAGNPPPGVDGSSVNGSSGDASEIAGYASVVVADRPIAYFRFEDGPGTTARDEMGGAPATLVSTRATSSGVRGSGAVELDGSGYVDLGQRFAITGTAPITFELWFTPDKVDSGWRRILSAESGLDATRQGWTVAFQEPNGLTVQRYRDGTAEGAILPMAAIQLSTPHHLVVAYDGAELAVYVDGALRQRSVATRPIAEIHQPLVIGGHSELAYGALRLTGVYDEIAVYNRALESDRVAAHYEAGRVR